jgi:hypothetical protein
MGGHRSQEAGKRGLSSYRGTLLKGIVSRIALLMLLLASWSLNSAILSNDPLQVNFSTCLLGKDRFLCRNQYLYFFNTYQSNITSSRYYSDDSTSNATRYTPISPVRNLTRSSDDYRIIMPRRGKEKPKKKTPEEQDEIQINLRLTEERNQLIRERDLLLEERVTLLENRQQRDLLMEERQQLTNEHQQLTEDLQKLTKEQLSSTNELHQSTNDYNHLTGATLDNHSVGRSEVTSSKGNPKDRSLSTTIQPGGENTMESEDPLIRKERIERNREEYLRKYKLSDEESRKLEQTKKDRQAEGKNPMDWNDQLAMKKYMYDTVAGKHNMKGSVSLSEWQRFRDSPGLKASIEATKREDEEEEERIRQEQEEDYESDPDLGGYTQYEIDRAYERGRRDKERDKVWHYEDPSSSDDDEDLANRARAGGQPRSLGAKTEEMMTTRVGAKLEEGTSTRAGAKTEDVMTTAITTTDQTSVRPPQCKEWSLGKKAQASYPRSRTEPESGQVDTQGSQKFRRRKRDNGTVTAVEGGGGL